MWRAAAIALAIAAVASGVAEACPGFDFQTGIFYSRPPPSRWLPPGALLLDVAFDDVSDEQLNNPDVQTLTRASSPSGRCRASKASRLPTKPSRRRTAGADTDQSVIAIGAGAGTERRLSAS